MSQWAQAGVMDLTPHHSPSRYLPSTGPGPVWVPGVKGTELKDIGTPALPTHPGARQGQPQSNSAGSGESMEVPEVINPDGRGFSEEVTPKTRNAKRRGKVRDEVHTDKFPEVSGSHQT